ncbi:MAG: PaaI family thioesterase [Candidatus Hydrothermota bacterium]|nr:MAG: PaaI family thioesterase [Candidatus Hydrothermae bacterium]
MSEWLRDDYCFACGKANPYGLKLKISTREDGYAETEFLPAREYQGYQGVMHGGIAATILDEIMVYAASGLGKSVATAKLTVRYKRPIPIGKPLKAIGKIKSVKGRRVEGIGKIIDKSGLVLAEAEALMIEV